MSKNRLGFLAQLSRHSHDLSAGYTSTIAPGMIVPQWFDVAQPGDTYYLQSAFKARLQDIVRAFYGEIDVHLDYFFVPLQMLFTPFGQVFMQTDDFISGFFQPSSQKDKFPLLDVGVSIQDMSQSNSETLDGHFECSGKEMARLFDSLDYNPFCICQSDRQDDTASSVLPVHLITAPHVSPWLFAAYQCIYQKYYRNDEFERLDVRSYNFDYNYNSTSFHTASMIQLRYAQRPSDYFTRLRVSPIASGINKYAPSGNDGQQTGGTLNEILLKTNTFLNPNTQDFGYQIDSASSLAQQAFPSATFASSITAEQAGNGNFLNTANIRALFAVDKFARIWGRADKTYDDQILAHFGIKIPHDVKHDITHIKHYHAALGAKPVYGTATTTQEDSSGNPSVVGTIGEVGGQGDVLLNTGEDKFTAPVHGVIMCVAYVVTKPSYLHTFSKLHLLTERLSFPIPEFDKLGAQPLYYFECHPRFLAIPSLRIGWQNRYAQFKEKYNRSSMTYTWQQYRRDVHNGNVYTPWVISRPAFDDIDHFSETQSFMMHADMFFERPTALDGIMAIQYDGSWHDSFGSQPHLMFQTDPLITEFYMRAKKVSWMSETGEPDL